MQFNKYIHTYTHTYIHTYIHTYMHRYIHRYIDTYIHTYIRIGEGGRKPKKRKKPQNSCRRRARNGGDMGEKRKKCRKEKVGSGAPNPENLGSNTKEAGGRPQGAQGSS